MNFPWRLRLVGILGAFSLVASVHTEDVAELLSKADAARLLGQPVISVKVIGPEKDDDAPAEGTHWIYQAGDGSLVVTRMTFASAAEAQKFTSPDFIKKQMDESEAKISVEAGVGEKSFWVVSAEAAGWTFLKGKHIGSIAFGGKKGGAPVAQKAALKSAAQTIAEKF